MRLVESSTTKADPLTVEFQCQVTKFVQFESQYKRYQNRRIIGQKWKLYMIQFIGSRHVELRTYPTRLIKFGSRRDSTKSGYRLISKVGSIASFVVLEG